MINKRFLFANVAIICVSATSIFLKFDGEIYLKLVGIIVSVYTVSQSYTDHKKISQGNSDH